jgi:hypothetical protein
VDIYDEVVKANPCKWRTFCSVKFCTPRRGGGVGSKGEGKVEGGAVNIIIIPPVPYFSGHNF